MIAGGSLPRPEDFGLSSDFLEHEPSLIIEPRRGTLCAVAVTLLVVAAVAVMSWRTGSASAALFLAPLFVVASLVLLLPLIVGVVCLAGKLEEHWRSVCNPDFRAWTRYRRALSECENENEEPWSLERQTWWLHAGSDQLRAQVAMLFGNHGAVEELDRLATGADLLVRDGDRTVVIRCEAGHAPAEVNVARELAMTRLELEADEAIIVAPAGGTPALHRYLERHPIRILDSGMLEALERACDSQLQ